MKLTEIKAASKTVADMKLNYTSGYLNLSRMALTSLEGSPEIITHDFECDKNLFTSLEGGPKEVKGYYDCSHCRLVTLKGAPKTIGSNIGSASAMGAFMCSYNQLTSLEYAPEKVESSFHCDDNKITHFKDIHKTIKFVGSTFEFSNNPIKSHILGLLMIEGIRRFMFINDKIIEQVLNSALREFPNEPKKRVLYAQKRLIDEHENGQELAKL